VTQFTYFQQVGSIDVDPVCLELTYGLERIAMFIQKKDNLFDLRWNDEVTYGDVHHQDEVQWSRYNFERADVPMMFRLFDMYEDECRRMLKEGLVIPAYDYVLKCSHAFNVLEARGAISVAERTGYIARVRGMARRSAEVWLQLREELGHPLLKKTAPAH
jgi:glycyl-tRNA synthetase alpha chain